MNCRILKLIHLCLVILLVDIKELCSGEIILQQAPAISIDCRCLRSNAPDALLREWRASTRMIMLGACSFLMGSNKSVAVPGDGETPVRQGLVDKEFWMDTTEVTVAQFGEFIKATRFQTTAEILGTSFAFVQMKNSGSKGYKGKFGWNEESGLNWAKSTGNGNHPVVHVSWEDAKAYCSWRGGDLPTETQWEYACRGGLQQCLYPWGDHLMVNETYMTNIWQGNFPLVNTAKDGYVFTAPVRSYPPNGFGFYDIVGNVWEWVLDTPKGFPESVKLQKGGSFLCHRRHCFRYRCGAKTKGSRDSTTANLGFRCIDGPS